MQCNADQTTVAVMKRQTLMCLSSSSSSASSFYYFYCYFSKSRLFLSSSLPHFFNFFPSILLTEINCYIFLSLFFGCLLLLFYHHHPLPFIDCPTEFSSSSSSFPFPLTHFFPPSLLSNLPPFLLSSFSSSLSSNIHIHIHIHIHSLTFSHCSNNKISLELSLHFFCCCDT